MKVTQATAYKLISNHGIAEMRQKISNGQNALFTLRSYKAGEVVHNFWAGTISAEPTYLTIQIGIRKHITMQPEFLQYINHSCDPNVFFDTTAMQVVALKDIREEEELFFFYPSAEWKMAQPFQCYCNNPCCLGEIKGAAYLAKEVLDRYRFTDFIQHQLAKRSTKKVAKKVA